MTFGQRIRTARLAAGLSQEELAYAISNYGDGRTISRTAIVQWESGATKEVEAGNLLKAAKILNINPEWLQFGTGDIKALSLGKPNLELIGLSNKKVPILSYTQTTSYMDIENKDVLFTGIDQELAAVTGAHIFAIVIKGESMFPDIKPGDIVIFDPDIKPLPGEVVLIKLEKEKTPILGKYRPLEKNGTDSAFEIIPGNEFWPKVIVNANNPGHIIGTLVEHRCRRRLIPSDQEDAV